MEKDMRIANLIQKFRKERGMTQVDLSEKSGFGLSVIKGYEIGHRKPKIEQLKVLADALEVSVNDFLDFEIESTSDVMSLINTLYTQTDLDIEGKKDKNGNYIPSSISLKFKDANINELLAHYMKAVEKHPIETPLVLMLHKDGVDVPVEITKRK
ncbi:MAG: helix-turn-helix transcriptional regulator [Eubacterium sp.]|nr:helix-turn-helix transcriptional regulator [Eubacterium sp.]